MNIKQETTEFMPEKKQLVRATAIAFGVAFLVLIIAILPAEYGIDPLGTGKALGLTGLSQSETSNEITTAPDVRLVIPQNERFAYSTTTVTIPPHTGQEYKFLIEEGVSFVYSWRSSATVSYDFHGEPKGDTKGTFQSYEQGRSDFANGTFIAPFRGTHGWYWENQTAKPVIIELRTSGYYEVVGNPQHVMNS
jgi:hypothetical protein